MNQQPPVPPEVNDDELKSQIWLRSLEEQAGASRQKQMLPDSPAALKESLLGLRQQLEAAERVIREQASKIVGLQRQIQAVDADKMAIIRVPLNGVPDISVEGPWALSDVNSLLRPLSEAIKRMHVQQIKQRETEDREKKGALPHVRTPDGSAVLQQVRGQQPAPQQLQRVPTPAPK